MRYIERVCVRVLIALACATVASPVTSAVAADSTSAAPSDMRAVAGAIDAQMWMSGNPGEAVAIVSVTLDESVQLPAVVQIPLVKGMVVDWAGEISDSGDISQDVELTYTLKDGAGGQYVEMRLAKFRVGQIDLSGKPMTVTGTDVSAVFEYVQSAPAVQTGFAVRLPPGAGAVRIDPAPVGDPVVNAGGESLYSLPDKVMKVGDAQTVSVSYSTAGEASAAGTGGSLNTVLGLLAAALVLAVGGLMWFVARQRRGSETYQDTASESSTEQTEDRTEREGASELDDGDDPFLIEE